MPSVVRMGLGQPEAPKVEAEEPEVEETEKTENAPKRRGRPRKHPLPEDKPEAE